MCNLFNRTEDIEVVGEAQNGCEALSLIEVWQPDVLVLDIGLPELSGIEVTQQLRQQDSLLPILAVSVSQDAQYIAGLLKIGATGYISKTDVPFLLAQAVRKVAQGQQGWFRQNGSGPKKGRH